MTIEEFKMLKPGNKIKVKDFSNFYNEKIVTVASIGSVSYNPRTKTTDHEIVTEYFQHNCECGCKGSSRLALHNHNADLID